MAPKGALMQVGGFQKIDKVDRGGFFDFQIFAKVRHIQQAAIVQAKVQEGVFQFENSPHPEQGRHIAFEHFVHNVFAQQLLGGFNGWYERALGKTAAHEIIMKMPHQGAREFAHPVELSRRPRKKSGQFRI